MTYITQSYLESLGFSTSWSREHGYRTQYGKYDKDVTRAIILISRTDLESSTTGKEDEVFDIWFWGQTPDGDYGEVDSHMTISTVEELETIMGYLRD